jgi:membrane-associated phospholipid phosphatase
MTKRPERVFGGLGGMLRESVSIEGLREAAKTELKWIGTTFLLLCVSLICAHSFWHIRAMIALVVDHSYKAYVIWLDSFLFGTVPSLWMQQHFRTEFFDGFFRWIWFSYTYVILLGAPVVFMIRGETKRYVLSCVLTLGTGLLVHYVLPTQPPWMAIDEVIRINGEDFTKIDKNLIAAMPSIHQAIICVLGCALWKYRIYGKVLGIGYNVVMAIALVYLGEHFVVDAILGIMIALGSWFAAKKILS